MTISSMSVVVDCHSYSGPTHLDHVCDGFASDVDVV